MQGQKNEIPEFILKLIDMIQIYQHIISWNENFTEIVVKDLSEMTATVLPKYFRHSKFESFVRQLNMYNFHKVCREKNNTVNFKNDLFYKGNENNFYKIRRKKKNESKSSISLHLEENIKFFQENTKIQPQIKQLLIQLLAYKNNSVHEHKQCVNLIDALSDQIKGSKLKKFDRNISDIRDSFQTLSKKSQQIQCLVKGLKHPSNSLSCSESTKKLKNSSPEDLKTQLQHYKSSFKFHSFRSIRSFLDVYKEQTLVKQQDHKSIFSIQLNEQP